jgi:hypothetical protein
MSEWHPIETAPKDGTPVIVWDGRFRAIARYEGATEFMPWDWMALCFAEQPYPARTVNPTHWMPLPAPPVGANLRVEPPGPKRRPDGRHYDAQGYCDNPGRGY